MENVLMIIAGLSFLAFVVGMFSPSTVRCHSRGRAALVYLGICLVCGFVGSAIAENKGVLSQANEQAAEEQPKKISEKPQEVPKLTIGSVYTMPYSNSNVQITFKDIKVKRIPDDGINLIFIVRIKNNSNDKFFISNVDWKLLDSEKVEVAESGVYEPMFGDFTPGMFFFTVVDPNIGKEEQIGYSVKKETYYLSIGGKVIAKIPLDEVK